MTEYYSEMFKNLLRAYYQGVLHQEAARILSDNECNKEEMSKIISSLCGVDIDYRDTFVEDLVRAIENYKISHRVVTKINCCSDCVDVDGHTICQAACPFGAIFYDQEKLKREIDENKCTDCGICVSACPNGYLVDKVQVLPILNLLKNNDLVIAAVAPSIVGQFGKSVTVGQLRSALKQIGFKDMVEVAFFADMISLKEAVEFDELIKSKEDFMLSSCCCPVWVGMTKRYYNDIVKYVSPSVSPMIAAGRVLKKINPDCKVVFIGPCVAKKAEAKNEDIKDAVDFVLDYAELKDVFEVLDIHPGKMPEEVSKQYASREGRMYGRVGGVSYAIGEVVGRMFPDKAVLYESEQANGVQECKELLDRALKRQIDATFIEGMGCKGGCVGGPKTLIPVEEGTGRIQAFADDSHVKVCLDNPTLRLFLSELDLTSFEDFKDRSKLAIFERRF